MFLCLRFFICFSFFRCSSCDRICDRTMSSHSMKHKNEPGGNEQQQHQQKKEGDDVVDLCSEDFDPLKALTSQSSTLVPVPGAPTFDNLSQFLASVRSRQPGQQRRDDLVNLFRCSVKHGPEKLVTHLPSLTLICCQHHCDANWHSIHGLQVR